MKPWDWLFVNLMELRQKKFPAAFYHCQFWSFTTRTDARQRSGRGALKEKAVKPLYSKLVSVAMLQRKKLFRKPSDSNILARMLFEIHSTLKKLPMSRLATWKLFLIGKFLQFCIFHWKSNWKLWNVSPCSWLSCSYGRLWSSLCWEKVSFRRESILLWISSVQM